MAEPLIGGEPGTGTGRILRNCLCDGRAPARPIAELGSTEAVKRAVIAGFGVSVVLALAVSEEAKSGRLVARPLKPALRKPLYLIWREDVPASHPLIAHLRHAAALQ
jgi:DNA-binding transcriptional LysR family regulator